MALIAQSQMKVDGQEIEPGDVIPKRAEESSSWVSQLQSGRVIAVPDAMLENVMKLSENGDRQVDLSKTIDEIEQAVKEVDSRKRLDELKTEEAQGKDRKGVYKILTERRDELD